MWDAPPRTATLTASGVDNPQILAVAVLMARH
jgi:hypothetical protein